MHAEQQTDMRTLAAARRWLNVNGMRQFELTDVERGRRVAEYARQVAEHGSIVAWLPPADAIGINERPMPVQHPHWH